MQYAHDYRIHPGQMKSSGAMLAPICLTNAGSCPSRQRDCVATAARSAETKGTAQLPYGSGETQGEASPPLRG